MYKMDPSNIPKDILRVLQDRELSVAQEMTAFNILMPNLPSEPKHALAYEENLEVGKMDKNFILAIENLS